MALWWTKSAFLTDTAYLERKLEDGAKVKGNTER